MKVKSEGRRRRDKGRKEGRKVMEERTMKKLKTEGRELKERKKKRRKQRDGRKEGRCKGR